MPVGGLGGPLLNNDKLVYIYYYLGAFERKVSVLRDGKSLKIKDWEM